MAAGRKLVMCELSVWLERRKSGRFNTVGFGSIQHEALLLLDQMWVQNASLRPNSTVSEFGLHLVLAELSEQMD